MGLFEKLHNFGLLTSADHGAGIDSDSFNAGLFLDIGMTVIIGNISVADTTLKVYSGASAGTKTTAETFRYRRSLAAIKSATGDQYGAWATSASLDLANASDDNLVIQIEFSPSDLTAGQHWVTVELGSGATVLQATISVTAVPRYSANVHPTAI